MQDPSLLSHTLVAPTLMQDLTGLSRQGMLAVAGCCPLRLKVEWLVYDIQTSATAT
jgi:hypothetical protein